MEAIWPMPRGRPFAWINRNGRLAKDSEATIASAEAFLYASTRLR
jgi:hypothetical protein